MLVTSSWLGNEIKQLSVLTNQKWITTRWFENPGLAILDLSMTIGKLFFGDFMD